MKLKNFSMLIAALLFVASCGEKTGPDNVTPGGDNQENVTPDPEPEPTPTPEPAGTKTLTFDMTDATAMAEWNTSAVPEGAESNPPISSYYTLDGQKYEFLLANPLEASVSFPYYNGTALFIKKYRYVGFPAIEGYKLTTAVVTDASGSEKESRGLGITSEIAAQVSNTNDGQVFVSGGEHISVPSNGEYTFDLTGTEAGKVYYLRAAREDILISKIVLTYDK